MQALAVHCAYSVSSKLLLLSAYYEPQFDVLETEQTKIRVLIDDKLRKAGMTDASLGSVCL